MVTALFHVRYVRAQWRLLATHRPWADYALISSSELVALMVTAWWLLRRLNHPRALEVFLLSFFAATVARYVLRKELLQDIRGLRREPRLEDAR